MDKKEKILRILLTAATILLLVLLAWQCMDIYLVGNSPANLNENGLHIQSVYRSEDVIARLSSLRIWAMGYLTLLVAVCMMLPRDVRKGSAVPMDPDNRLRLMKKKLTNLPEKAQAEESLRKKIGYGAAAVILLCSAVSLRFLLNRDNFTSWDLEKVMGQMLVHTFPWIILAFAAAFAAFFLCRRSMEREILLLKVLTGDNVPEITSKYSCLPWVRIALYGAAVILILLGIGNGGMRDVLVKAINICTECIGLG